jgi:hypothetical protein
MKIFYALVFVTFLSLSKASSPPVQDISVNRHHHSRPSSTNNENDLKDIFNLEGLF